VKVAVVSIAEFIEPLKEALISSLYATPVAALLGLVEVTAGAESGVELEPEPPHPATTAVSSKSAVHISRLE
jgi:hypothetical protein